MGNTNISGFLDTAEWQLIILIAADRFTAILKNIEEPHANLIKLVDKEWKCDADSILKEIETVVYDNPRLIDDFSTTIIIDTYKALWVPAKETENEEFDPIFFTSVYPTLKADISLANGERESCLFTLAPGLNSFLLRTLPGCKINCGLNVLKDYFETHRMDDAPQIHVHIHGKNADLVAFDSKGEFLAAASHRADTSDDLAYKILLICNTFGTPVEEWIINVYGERDIDNEFIKFLSDMGVDFNIEQFALPYPELPFPLAIYAYNKR